MRLDTERGCWRRLAARIGAGNGLEFLSKKL
jgi:hypothetical protein